MQMIQQINKTKMVWVLSHWDDGVIGIYNKINDAKFKVMCNEGEYYRGFSKCPDCWFYKSGGYYIQKMSIDKAEVLCRWNEE